ncbi:HutD family protein [Undibacterium sp. TJN25]|uniref:HutD/Ves family protein n=1 Tax=Undibacterium sp. TJN25 TaxID=3413056 RepID=UPI003BF1F4D7
MISLLPAATRIARPWKNGGGSTLDILAEPPGAGMDDFGWRISVATIVDTGPFSEFKGVDRSLFLLSDAPLQLLVDEVRFQLDPGQPVLRFSGEARVRAEAVAAPLTVLNVMSRRDCFTHRLSLHQFDNAQRIPLDGAAAHLLFVQRGTCRLSGHPWILQQYDAVLAMDEAEVLLQAEGRASVAVITLSRA